MKVEPVCVASGGMNARMNLIVCMYKAYEGVLSKHIIANTTNCVYIIGLHTIYLIILSLVM